MPKAGAVSGVAVVLILLLAAVLGYWLGRADSGRWASPNGSNYDACENGDYNRCKTQPVIIDPVDNQYTPANPIEQSHRNEYRDERDLAAQREMATWARAAFFASLISIVLLFVTWNATVQGVKETRRIGEAQTRAYVGGLDGRIKKHSDGGYYVYFTLKNYGQSPATRISVDGKIVFKTIIDWPQRHAWIGRPNAPTSISAGGSAEGFDYITPNTIQAVLAEGASEVRFYYMARISWRDVFKVWHSAEITFNQPIIPLTAEIYEGSLCARDSSWEIDGDEKEQANN